MFSCQGQGTSENLCISSTPSIRCHGETHPNRTATPPSILGPCHTENGLSLKSWWHLVAWPCLGLPLVLHFLTCNPRSFNVHQSCSLQPTVITAPFIRKAVCLHSQPPLMTSPFLAGSITSTGKMEIPCPKARKMSAGNASSWVEVCP